MHTWHSVAPVRPAALQCILVVGLQVAPLWTLAPAVYVSLCQLLIRSILNNIAYVRVEGTSGSFEGAPLLCAVAITVIRSRSTLTGTLGSRPCPSPPLLSPTSRGGSFWFLFCVPLSLLHALLSQVHLHQSITVPMRLPSLRLHLSFVVLLMNKRRSASLRRP